jgi:hypothetical protein
MNQAFIFIIQKYLFYDNDDSQINNNIKKYLSKPLPEIVPFDLFFNINNEMMRLNTSDGQICNKQFYVKLNFFYNFISTNLIPKSKFIILNNTMDNIFNTPCVKKYIMQYFSRYQRTYKAFSKLGFLYKLKKMPYSNDCDLLLNKLDPNNNDNITILDANRKYLFSLTDLVNIIYNSLCHSPYFILSPKSVKNPYTNLPFSKANLYNIYFFILFRKVIVPSIVHYYFLTNFDLKKMKYKHHDEMQSIALKRYVYNSHCDLLHNSIMDMIYEHNFKRRLLIHHDFPKSKLVEIMRPYLTLYYKSKYSGTRYQNTKYYNLLRFKMGEFINFNPNFGKKIKMDINIFGSIESFNDSHPGMHSNDYVFQERVKKNIDNFIDSHLDYDSDNETNYSDDEDDDDFAFRQMSY